MGNGHAPARDKGEESPVVVEEALRVLRIVLLALEAGHFLVWFISMIIVQVAVNGPEGGEASWIRLEHFLLAFHFVAPVAVITLEHEEGRFLSGVWQFFILLTVFGTDLRSLLETVIHLKGELYPQYIALTRALAAISLGLISAWLLWYASAYLYHRSIVRQLEQTDTAYKKLDGDGDNNNVPAAEHVAHVIANASGAFVPRLVTRSK